MKYAILSVICVLLFFNLNCQNWQWAIKISTSGDDTGKALASDVFGNIYLGARNGYTVGDILSKHDANGNLLWARVCSGAIFVSVATDKVGDVYACGYFANSAYFNGGNANDTTVFSNGTSWDGFLVKYNTSGDLLWVKIITSQFDFYDEAKCVRVDQFSNAYVTGSSYKMVNSVYKRNFYLKKYDLTGNLLWTEDSGWKGNMNSTSIALDNNNNCYIAGGFTDSAFFANSVLTANGGAMFLAKFSAHGQLKWAIKDGSGLTLPKSMVERDGKITLSGLYSHSTSIGQQYLSGTNQNLFIAQCDSSANFIWATSVSNAKGESLVCDKNGNLYLTGTFKKTGATFGGTTLTSQKLQEDIFVSKCDSLGTFQWAIAPSGDTFGSNWSSAITLSGNQIIITGRFSGTTNFGNIPLMVTNSNYADLFLAALDDNGVYTSLKDTEAKTKFKIWPNPSSEYIVLENSVSDINSINLVNALGEKIPPVFLKDKPFPILSTEHLVPGVYIIIVENGISQKFIKH